MKFQRLSSQPEAIVLQSSSFDSRAVSGPRVERSHQSNTHPLVTAIANVWRSCLRTMGGSSDPVVTLMNRGTMNGEDSALRYSVYDPVTQERVTGLSETEVRTWLDQRYYR